MDVSIEGLGVKYETIEVEQLEPLFIYEEGDEVAGEANGSRGSGSELPLLKEDYDDASNECGDEGEAAGMTEATDVRTQTWEGHESQDEGEMESEKETMEPCEQEANEEEQAQCEVGDGGETTEGVEEMLQEKLKEQEGTDTETERDQGAGCGQTEGASGVSDGESAGEKKRDEGASGVQVAVETSSALRPKDRLCLPDAAKQMRRLTTDFPDSLYELLCSLQEGRRLNDQRCSFRFERRCHSEPSTPVPRHKVFFSSMTSLQKEEFFDLLATTQGRRLDDQRAELQNAPPARPRPQNRLSRKKSSQKEAELKEVPVKPATNEELYNMILTSQAQGRMEDQRTAAPGPMDDEDFFSLLLKVQGGRLEEQRTELPFTLRH